MDDSTASVRRTVYLSIFLGAGFCNRLWDKYSSFPGDFPLCKTRFRKSVDDEGAPELDWLNMAYLAVLESSRMASASALLAP